jgi:ubiquinone/menaquinone biosynthesis C-methylase UbiE
MIEPGASRGLYDALAPGYEEHFSVAHRRAYDELAWATVEGLLPAAPGRIVDIGCGVGRWARRLVDLGHSVVGIECAPSMAAHARRHVSAENFELIEQPVEDVELPTGHADLVLAMGSLQYTVDPSAVLAKVRRWLVPGGAVAILVDSLVALVLELSERGNEEEALDRLRTRTATWVQGGRRADYHLLDAQGVRDLMEQAGFIDIEVGGLLVGWTIHGRSGMLRRLECQWAEQLEVERSLAKASRLADAGKQLIGVGRVAQAATR